MKAVVYTEKGVTIQDVPKPQIRPHEMLVKVRACGLIRVDIGMASGKVHAGTGGMGEILGREWSGEVVEKGSAVEGFSIGDRVMSSGSGGWAEYVATDWRRAYPIPKTLDFIEGCALPVALQTMHDAVVTHGRLQSGESILIQGASSGVGLVALQLARLKGAKTIMGSSTNPAKRARLAEFGADVAIDSTAPSWSERVLAATGGKGVDLIVDQVSGAMFAEVMKSAALEGRIVNVGRLGGKSAPFDFDLHALKRLDYIGVTFRTRTPEEVGEVVRRAREDLLPHIEAKRLMMPVDKVFPFDEVQAALAYMGRDAHFGKIALTLE